MTTSPSPAEDTKLGPDVIRAGTVVVLGTIMAILDTTIVAVALDTLAKDFHVSISTIQWVTTGYLLSLAVVIPVTGWAVHRIGAKPLYITSLALFIIGSALCGLAWSATSLIMFRILQGVGGGMIMPVGQTIMARTAGPKKMGQVMGIIGVPTLLGPILGPVIGGAIVTNISWRWIFFVNVPIGIVALILAVRFLKPSERDREHRFDLFGFALLSPGLALIVYGLSQVGNGGGFGSSSVKLSLTIGVVLCIGFVFRSLRAPEPLMEMRLFKNRTFSIASICIFLTGATLYGTMFLLPLYYQVVRGESPWMAGLLMAPQGIGAALMMRKAGIWSDRYGARRVVPVGMAILALGTFAYTQVSGSTNYAFLAGALFVRGIGLGLGMMPVFAASYRDLSHHEIPRATTATNILRQVGGSLGVAIFAVVLQTQIEHRLPGAGSNVLGQSATAIPVEVVDKLAQAFATSFWWSFGTCLLAVIPALFLPSAPAAVPSAPMDEMSELDV
jgi:EmrB/QacA subfamily drug resistance transporter